MKTTLNGFKTEGSWEDIVEHGEKITTALQAALDQLQQNGDTIELCEEQFEEWDSWRPKTGEQLNTDVSEKTAETNRIKKSSLEQEGETATENVWKAEQELEKTVSLSRENEKRPHDMTQMISHIVNATSISILKLFRSVEHFVYENIMTSVSPYYFDNKLISANITKKGDSVYSFETNINDDVLRERVGEIIADIDDSISRWRINTEPEVTTVSDAEGTPNVEDTPSEKSDEVKQITDSAENKDLSDDEVEDSNLTKD